MLGDNNPSAPSTGAPQQLVIHSSSSNQDPSGTANAANVSGAQDGQGQFDRAGVAADGEK